ncbi:zf-CCHC domain-containing protein [Tanacetum coccineum]
MACSLPHTGDEVEALVQKLIDEDMVRQKAILDLALQFENACTAKDDLRKAYEKYEEALRETLEEEARDEKEREEKIRQNKLTMRNSLWNLGYDPWEFGLDIDDSDLHLTPVLTIVLYKVLNHLLNPNPVRIIPGPVCFIQQAKLLKENVFILDSDGALMSSQEYMQRVVEDVGKDDDFKSGSWVSTTNYVNANGDTVTGCLGDIKNFLKNRKLDQVVAIVKSCSPNVFGDLTVTMKDISCTIPGTIHHKVIGDGGYGNDITVGAALILANVSVFTSKPSMHYLNITKKNVVKFSVKIQFLPVTVINALPYYVIFFLIM